MDSARAAALIFETIRRYSRKSRFVGKAFLTDVTTTESHLLVELDAHPGKNIGDLCAALRLDRSTLSRSLEGLVKRGLLRSERQEGDRRNKSFAYTPAGRKLLTALDDAANICLQPFIDNLTPEEMARLLVHLKYLLDRDDAPPVMHRPVEPPILVEMRRVSRVWGLIGRSILGTGYSASVWQLLMEIKNSPVACSPGDLCDLFRLAQTTVSLNLRRLERDGLIEKRRSEHDGRRVEVRLSEGGLKLLAEIDTLAVERISAALRPLSPGELREFVELLAKYADEPLAEDCSLLQEREVFERLESEAQRQSARAVLVEWLLRAKLHFFLPETLLGRDSLCWALLRAGELLALAEVQPSSAGWTLAQFSVDETRLPAERSRAFFERVLRSSAMIAEIQQLTVPRASTASWLARQAGAVEVEGGLLLSVSRQP